MTEFIIFIAIVYCVVLFFQLSNLYQNEFINVLINVLLELGLIILRT